jgi:thermostable 8-oxoguanine DNA glycosylase
MITPTTITNYNRTEEELEEFLMFAILVAGKGAEQQAKKLDQFLRYHMALGLTPFETIDCLNLTGSVRRQMESFKLGQYNRIESAFQGILQFQGRLKTVTVEELESVKGISSKTSRFFILHTRPNARIACLDTHILAHMRDDLGIDTPKTTPSKKKYLELEKKLLDIIDKSGKTFAEYDLDVWKSRSQKSSTL